MFGDLVRRGAREDVEVGIVARHLEGGEMGSAMRLDPLDAAVGACDACLQLDAEFDLLAALGIGHRHGRNVADLGKHLYHRFDLLVRDVLATTPNHLFDPANNVVVAVLVAAKQIPGAEPAFTARCLGGFLLVPVALEYRAARNLELTDLSRPDLAPLCIADASAPPRPRQAARA